MVNKIEKWNIENIVEKNKISHEILDAKKEKIYKKIDSIKQNYINGLSKYSNEFILINEKQINFKESKNIVFIDEFNDYRTGEKENKFKGLEKQQLFFENSIDNKPIYIIDNHNKAIFCFFEILNELKKINKEEKVKLNLIHIDAHRDDAKFQYKYPQEVTWENINDFIKKTRVSDYIDFAQKTKIVNEVLNITQSFEFEYFLNNKKFINYKNKEEIDIKLFKKEPYILNLDIDIFGGEGTMVDNELKIKTILKAWDEAIGVVIAMSPGFILRKDAEDIIKILLEK